MKGGKKHAKQSQQCCYSTLYLYLFIRYIIIIIIITFIAFYICIVRRSAPLRTPQLFLKRCHAPAGYECFHYFPSQCVSSAARECALSRRNVATSTPPPPPTSQCSCSSNYNIILLLFLFTDVIFNGILVHATSFPVRFVLLRVRSLTHRSRRTASRGGLHEDASL